jgi:hypothetical protein
MTAFLTVINGLLALRIVQYLLCLAVTLMLVTMGWMWLKNNKLTLEKAYYETEYAKVSAGLATQNEAVEQLALKTAAQKDALDQAVNKASKLATLSVKQRKPIVEYVFTGECSQKVEETLLLIQGAKDENQ